MDHLMCDPHTTHQQDLMGLDYHLKIQGDMMADLNERVPLQKAAQVKLDNLGQIILAGWTISGIGWKCRIRLRW